MEKGDKYIPALGLDRLTPLYDPWLRWIMREETFKRRLIDQAQIRAGHRVLDLGCGTATLTILIKHIHPQVEQKHRKPARTSRWITAWRFNCPTLINPSTAYCQVWCCTIWPPRTNSAHSEKCFACCGRAGNCMSPISGNHIMAIPV